jgi:hypothetical protein
MSYPKAFTAHHEASHAVINLRLGFDVAMVTIKPDPRRGSEGYVKSAPGGRLWKIVDDVRIAHRGEQQISSVRSVMDRTLGSDVTPTERKRLRCIANTCGRLGESGGYQSWPRIRRSPLPSRRRTLHGPA